ncbi:MAG: hypothetical protein ACXVYB_17440 [Arthrobacter sp.]
MFEKSDYADDSERFIRWAQASALFPMMQFSLAPWRALAEKEVGSVRKALAIRSELTPYLLDLVDQAAETGEPILRNLEYVFPHHGFARITDQLAFRVPGHSGMMKFYF